MTDSTEVPVRNRGRPKTPESEKIDNDGLFVWQKIKIAKEAKRLGMPFAMHLRNIVTAHYHAVDGAEEKNKGLANVAPELAKDFDLKHEQAYQQNELPGLDLDQ